MTWQGPTTGMTLQHMPMWPTRSRGSPGTGSLRLWKCSTGKEINLHGQILNQGSSDNLQLNRMINSSLMAFPTWL